MISTAELGVTTSQEAELPVDVSDWMREHHPELDWQQSVNGSWLAYTSEGEVVEVRQLSRERFSDLVRNKNDEVYTTLEYSWLVKEPGNGKIYKAPETETDLKTPEGLYRVSVYPAGSRNFLEIIAEGGYFSNLALLHLARFIVHTDKFASKSSPEAIFQRIRRPNPENFVEPFMQNREQWKQEIDLVLQTNPDLEATFKWIETELYELSAELDLDEIGTAGMHGDPNFSRYWMAPLDLDYLEKPVRPVWGLVASRFDRRTGHYMGYYNIASTISYIALQLGNIKGIKSFNLVNSLLKSYKQLASLQSQDFTHSRAVFTQRMLGDLRDVLSNKVTQEGFPVDYEKLAGTLPAIIGLLKFHTRGSV